MSSNEPVKNEMFHILKFFKIAFITVMIIAYLSFVNVTKNIL